MSFVNDEDHVDVILKVLKEVRDEEILANANKTLRIMLRDDHKIHDLLVANQKAKKEEFNNPGVYLGFNEATLSHIINSVLEEINVHDFSEIVLIEATAAILNFVKRQELVKFIIPKNISYLVSLVMEGYDKPKVLAIQSLQLIGRVEEYKNYISQLGAEDILEINV